MPHLSKVEISQHHAWLSEWRAPAEMADYVGVVNDAMGSTSFFRQRHVQFLRDAWLAAEFGRHRQSSLVRLIPERDLWPDFEARAGDEIEGVECAEVDIENRRRGDEYPDAEKKAAGIEPIVECDPVEDWITRADQVPATISDVIKRKVAKHYPPTASLLLNLNIVEFGIRQAEIEAAMAPRVAPALPHFRRVWILWKSRLYGPFG